MTSVTAATIDLARPEPLQGFAAAAPVGAPGPAGTLQTLANYLVDDFWGDFSGSDPRWFNLGSSGTGANSGTIFYNVSGFSGT